MKFLNNIRIKQKILGSFIIVILLSTILSVIGIVNIYKVDVQYTDNIENSLQILTYNEKGLSNFQNLRRGVRDLIIYAEQPDKYSAAINSITEYYNTINTTINEYKAMPELNKADSKTLDELTSSLDNYMSVYRSIDSYIQAGDTASAEKLMEGDGKTYAESTQKLFSDAFDSSVNAATSSSASSSALTNQTVLLIIVLALVILAVSLILSIAVARNITAPVHWMVECANKLATGNLDFNAAINSRDEIGELSGSLNVVIDTINSLISNINGVITDMNEKGDVDARLDANKFQGSYKSLANGFNAMLDAQMNDNLDAIRSMQDYANGNFDVKLKRHIGKKVVMDETWDLMQANLKDFFRDITELISAASAGQLDKRIDTSRYRNNWADMASGLNSVLDGVIAPIDETIQVVDAMSKGELSVRIQGSYSGDYAVMKTAINNTLSTVAGYIREIAYVLNEMSNENFDLEIVNDYIGDFAPIKVSLNKIIDVFNNILSEINMSAEQVAAGARHISESSMSLAQGATEQASSVEELSSTIETITDQTRQNAEYAGQANALAQTAKESAALGSSEMNSLQKAMQEINESSENISKIIKVIDDIAFQTTLLALNAAIEAAGAGKFGKGFAVVAAEVSNLATRSKNAASDTTVLIQNTVDKVKDGTRIANQTASTLETIVGQISDISLLINDVADSSVKQEEAIKQVNTGIDQISQVTQTNTAASEEEASSAQELSSQSEVFKNMVSKFRLRKPGNKQGKLTRDSQTVYALSDEVVRTPDSTTKQEPVSKSNPKRLSKPDPKLDHEYVTKYAMSDSKPKKELQASSKTALTSMQRERTVTKPSSPTQRQTASAARPISKSAPIKPAAKMVTNETNTRTDTTKAKNIGHVPAKKTGIDIPEGSGAAIYNRKDFGKY